MPGGQQYALFADSDESACRQLIRVLANGAEQRDRRAKTQRVERLLLMCIDYRFQTVPLPYRCRTEVTEDGDCQPTVPFLAA